MSEYKRDYSDNPSTQGHGLPANKYNNHAWIIGDPKIGENVWVGAFCVIDGSGGLEIGEGCDISCGVHIYTHSSVMRCVSNRKHPDVDRAPVKIGKHTFIGANAVINKGVNIGDHCVVGAGAVVTKDVPDHTVVGGVPAKPIARVEIDDAGNVRIAKLEK